jgi:hypothetical protein
VSTPAPPPSSFKTWTKTADRPLRSLGKSVGIWVFAHFVGVPVPWRAVRQTDGRALLAYEHERLQAPLNCSPLPMLIGKILYTSPVSTRNIVIL